MHNHKVGQNVAALQEKVEQAQSQGDLVALIRSLKHHPGPLDYRQNHWRLLALVLFVCGLIAGAALFVDIPEVFMPVFIVLRFSGHWLPVVALAGAALWYAEKGQIPGPLKKVNPPWVAVLLVALLVLALSFIPHWQYFYWSTLQTIGEFIFPVSLGDPGVALALIQIPASIWLAYKLYRQANWRAPLSDRITQRDALFNNGLEVLEVDGVKEAESLVKRFHDFRRGNDERRVTRLCQGYFEGQQQSFGYRICQYRYVVRKVTSYTDSKGNLRTRTERQEYYRHSLITTLGDSVWMGISGDRGKRFDGVEYKSEDDTFNRHLRCWAKSHAQADEFLTDEMRRLLLQMVTLAKNPVLEVLSDGSLCLAVDDDMLALERRSGLHDPDAFAREIGEHAELQTLDGMLQLIERLRQMRGKDLSGELEVC